MARYGISAEGAAEMRALSKRIYESANGINEASASLQAKIVAAGEGLGVYAAEIQGLVHQSRNILNANRESFVLLSQSIQQKANEIEDLISLTDSCQNVEGTHLSQSGVANSYLRATGGADTPHVAMTSELSNEFLSRIPGQRRNAIYSSYANAPVAITDLLNQYVDCLQQTQESGYGYNKYGERVKNGSFYSPDGRYIAMNENMNDDEYTDVFKHEAGHFIDHMMGSVSSSSQFMDALNRDSEMLSPLTFDGQMRLQDMLDDAFSTGACFDRNITDILSALTRNSSIVTDRFFDESVTGYVAYYRHEDEYWDSVDQNGRSLNMRGKEIFANLFAIETDQYQISVNFVNRWFPSLSNAFSNLINGGAVNEQN